MKLKAEEIIKSLNIDEPILAIYPYGSRVYGCAREQSDYDFIIVTKNSMLKSGAFKQNAISSDDRMIQGVLYSRSGFIDAINNYDMGAMESLSLDPSDVVLNSPMFKIQKWDEKEMIKKIITKVSASWHIADLQAKDDDKESAKKGIYHALRILMFGLQLKKDKKITDFSVGNKIKEEFSKIDNELFDTRNYIKRRDELMSELRNYEN